MYIPIAQEKHSEHNTLDRVIWKGYKKTVCFEYEHKVGWALSVYWTTSILALT